ncbi:MAG: hypothetical protein Q9M36_03020 [Sulfurovum sp.]|nr:hypothetical protein [Sulfurovum sp.]
MQYDSSTATSFGCWTCEPDSDGNGTGVGDDTNSTDDGTGGGDDTNSTDDGTDGGGGGDTNTTDDSNGGDDSNGTDGGDDTNGTTGGNDDSNSTDDDSADFFKEFQNDVIGVSQILSDSLATFEQVGQDIRALSSDLSAPITVASGGCTLSISTNSMGSAIGGF